MMGNAEVVFGLEFGTFQSWRPDEAALARVAQPVQVMWGAQSAPFFAEASGWIAQHLSTALVSAPDTHVPNVDRPEDLVGAIRLFLRAR
jgi:pimeloyl-ACP methyl ester carboxylesterase